MDESAIRLIQQTAIGDYNGKQACMSEGTVALPDNYKIHNLECYQPNRRRFRGVMTTESLSDFVGYVKRSSGPMTKDFVEGFIDAEKRAATVFFNLNDEDGPGHADWRAVLMLHPTAAYTALRAIEGKQLTQRQLIEWLEDWHRNIVELTNEDGILITSTGHAVQAIRKLEIMSKKESVHTEENRRAARSAMEEVEAKATEHLPDRISFECEPFLGLPARQFGLRVSVLTDHDDPRLVLRIVNREAHEEAITQDFKAVLLREIADDAVLTIGSFDPK